jgi:hypothetical protein
MKTTGRIIINSIRIQELERNTDILSTGSISPPTVPPLYPPLPLSVGPELTIKA